MFQYDTFPFKKKIICLCCLFLVVMLIIYFHKAHFNEKLFDIKITNVTKTALIKEKCQNFDNKTSQLLNMLLLHSNNVSKEERTFMGLKDLAVVSFSSLNHVFEAIRSCDSFQQNPTLNGTPFLMFFDNNVSENVKDLYSKLCPIAKIITLNLSDYPSYVQDLGQYRFKAIYQSLALQKYKAILNIDTSIRFNKTFNFSDLIPDAIKTNPTDVTLLSPNNHNMFSVTHPKMFECFPNINVTETQIFTQYKSGLILWIGSESGWRIMNKFVSCALHPDCMGPIGSTSKCDSSNTIKYPNRFSGCHRYDQSAINLILLEESNNNPSVFQRESNAFKVQRNSTLTKSF